MTFTVFDPRKWQGKKKTKNYVKIKQKKLMFFFQPTNKSISTLLFPPYIRRRATVAVVIVFVCRGRQQKQKLKRKTCRREKMASNCRGSLYKGGIRKKRKRFFIFLLKRNRTPFGTRHARHVCTRWPTVRHENTMSIRSTVKTEVSFRGQTNINIFLFFFSAVLLGPQLSGH